MNIDTCELWCEHEFVVPVKRRSATETHFVSVYGDSEVLEDRVFAPAEDRLIKLIHTCGDERMETEYNSSGGIRMTRHIEPGEPGTFFITELSQGSLRSEKFTVKTVDGKKVVMREQLIANGIVQSQTETHFAPNGKDPAISKTKSFSRDGRVVREDRILWHGENRPAVTETTEFDWYGTPEVTIKVMHNADGDALWEERTEVAISS